MGSLKSNERSEAIELIKQAQLQFEQEDLVFKSASGELSLRENINSNGKRYNTLFPDVLYFSDKSRMQVILGWELKMPDTDLNDEELKRNAIDKAKRLGTNSFVLWNFRHVAIYVFNDSNNVWENIKFWDDLDDIDSRDLVKRNEDRWIALLRKVNVYLNNLFNNELLWNIPITITIDSFMHDISNRYTQLLSNYYSNQQNRMLDVTIKQWYELEKIEYVNEKNKPSLKEMTNQFSRSILIRWLNRITFSNLIQPTHNSIREALNSMFNDSVSIQEVADLFNEATKVSDFYTIIHVSEIESNVPEEIYSVIRQYSYYLYQKNLEYIDTEEFQKVLEQSIYTTKRELMGLYTTPKLLADLLVKITLINTDDHVLDPTTGSGTIASQAISVIGNRNSLNKAHELVWASDKYSFPLQVANLSLSSKDSVNMVNKVFQKDLFLLKVGEEITIVNPKDGEKEKYKIPEYATIVANLPFIRSERASREDKIYKNEINEYLKSIGVEPLSLKSDVFQFMIIHLHRLLKSEGRLGVIVSNSWLKTKNRKGFYQVLSNFYNVEYVVLSEGERWFRNADIITTIIVLSKRTQKKTQLTHFVKISKNLESIKEEINDLANGFLMGSVPENLAKCYSYNVEQINSYINNGLSLNILFNDIRWFEEVQKTLKPMKEVFHSRRGTKSGNNEFFYGVKKDEVEEEFVFPILKSSSSINSFYASSDGNVFSVGEKTLAQLLEEEKIKSVKYIKSYENKPKTKTQLTFENWYQYPAKVTGDFVTSLNPDKRLFWSAIPHNLCVDQRLTVFKIKKSVDTSKTLIHALLNSYIGQFMIESTGFGRGLGALDTTSSGIMDSSILNYELLSDNQKKRIETMWRDLSRNTPVPTIIDCIYDDRWNQFNKFIFQSFGIEKHLNNVKNTLEQSIKLRSEKRL